MLLPLGKHIKAVIPSKKIWDAGVDATIAGSNIGVATAFGGSIGGVPGAFVGVIVSGIHIIGTDYIKIEDDKTLRELLKGWLD